MALLSHRGEEKKKKKKASISAKLPHVSLSHQKGNQFHRAISAAFSAADPKITLGCDTDEPGRFNERGELQCAFTA